MKIAYVRANNETSIENQKYIIDTKTKIDKWVIENKEKSALKQILDELNEGDNIFIVDMARISRNIKEVVEVIEVIKTKGATINILNSQIDVNSPEGKLALYSALAVQEELVKAEEN